MQNKIVLDVIVAEDEANLRLDKFICLKLPSFSRVKVQRLIENNLVSVNGKTAKSSYKVVNGDKVEVSDEEVSEVSLEGEDIPLDILYEDDDLFVINKPKGMVVHPSVGHHSGTLVNALLYKSDNLSSINGEVRPGIVHRIDKDTSGLLVVAKNDEAHQALQAQLKSKTMYRKYIAIVYGIMESSKGIIDAPIGRDPKNRQKMAVVKDGKEAITHFEVIEQYKDFAYIECLLETGRTHQIRVHMDYIGHPVIGDPMYGPAKVIGSIGQYLHALEIHFVHPTTHKEMVFKTDIPAYFSEKLKELKK